MDDILIVEDDRALSQGIRLGLEGEGRRFIQASTLAQGERALEERTFSYKVVLSSDALDSFFLKAQ